MMAKLSFRTDLRTKIGPLAGLFLLVIIPPDPVWAQREVTSEIYRDREREMISRIYEKYERRPRPQLPFVEGQMPRKELIFLAPTAERVRRRSYMSDSHWGLKFYKWRTCIECHPRQARSLHNARGRITCRQCHGEEPIAGNKHYYSSMNPRQRHALVCAKCHKGSSASYATYMIHEPTPLAATTQKKFPLLFYAFWIMVAIAGGTFIVFLPHTFLWGLRELLARNGGSSVHRVRRFSPVQRSFHLFMIVAFCTQAMTGIIRLYFQTDWGSFLASLFGGYHRTLTIHKWGGIFMLALFSVHILYLVFKIDWRRFPKSIYGPDSLLPRWEDLGQAFQHLGWLLGRRKPPQFDRWGYWEKFDYWGVFWGMMVLGGTGLILFKPTISSLYMPGWVINVALWVHRIEAILAIAHVFIIHFFISHLRRHSFPMDLAMFEGSVDLEKTRHERPAWIERLEKSGRLQGVLVAEARPGIRVLFYLFGFTALGFGLFLLIGGLINSPSIAW